MKNQLTKLFAACLLLISTSATAIEVTGKLQSTSAAPVHKGDSLQIFTTAAGGSADYNIHNIVSLKVDQNTDTFLTNATSVRVKLKIYRWNAANVAISPTRNENLIVSINNRYAQKTIDLASLKLENGYKLRVIIDSIFINGSPVTILPRFVYLETEISMTRYYDFSSVVNTPVGSISIVPLNTNCDADSIKDELKLMWGTVPEAVEYQVEWTYVNDYGIDTTTFLSKSQLTADFKNNSTRITTARTDYRISLTYERGYIAFRVRAVGRDYLHPDTYMYTVWSEADAGSMNSVSSGSVYEVTAAHEVHKNWQYSATFAEEGKKKEVISYFDGSLHNRQSVTKVNSDKNVIVGETLYDYQGRPAVNILPTPVNFPACSTSTTEPAIKYYPQYNQNMDTVAYSKEDFDKDSGMGVCNPAAPAMDTLSGSSQYYSGNNPDKSYQQAFVPDAELYPFSQVEYTPDNTGRIRAQSGVGKKFQLGGGHETKYLYGQPNQLQLDRLFGSEAGDASHYKKNTVIDANGQASVSYLNQEGKTIATALAGNSADSLQAIPSEANAADTLTVDLFNKNSSGHSLVNKITPLQDGIEFSTQLTVNYTSNYKFKYGLTVDSLLDPCLLSGLCMSCIYDLEIKVTNDCGSDLTSTGTYNSQPIHKAIGHLDSIPNGFTMNCAGSTLVADSITLSLDPGTYTVSKVLTINKKARDFYVKNYMDTTYNSCTRTLSDFVAAQMAALDTTSCYVSCSACAAALGTRDDFVASGKGTELQYDLLYEKCMDPCKPASLCQSSFEMMLIDVSPGGQYGKFDAATVTSSDRLSVFNETNMLNPNQFHGGTTNWKHPKLSLNGSEYAMYMDEDGNRTHVPVIRLDSVNYSPEVDAVSKIYTDANGDLYTFPENLKFLNDFIPAWDPYFAHSLVSYHPEYVYYLRCSEHAEVFSGDTMSSEHFDSLLIATETFAEAVTNGFIKNNYDSISVNPDNKFTDLTTHSSAHLYDPFFTNTAYSLSYIKPGGVPFLYPQSSMQNEMRFTRALYAIINHTGYSMVEIAALTARCGGNYTSIPTGTCMAFGTDVYSSLTPNYVFKNDSIRDREWNFLKTFYLSEKRKIQFQRMDFSARYYNWTAPDWYGGCNACMMSSFNMAGSGLLGPNAHPYSPAAPAYNKKQPCSIYSFPLYANSQKRFTTPEGAGLTIASVPYLVYQQTGQCPMAFMVQNFMSAMSQDSLLDETLVSLNTEGAFGPDMYTALNGGTTPSTFINYQWDTVSTTGHILKAVIKNPLTGACADTMTLNINSTPISNFKSIIGIQNLTFDHLSGGRYFFKTIAVYNTGSTIASANITGSTRIDIKDCNFKPECTGNQFAADLANLMSVLAIEGKWTSTTAYNISRDSLTSPLITPTIKNMLGTPNSTLMWKFTSGPKTFDLYDSTNSGTKLTMTNLSATPAISNILLVKGLSNIRSDYNNLFKLNVLDSTGAMISLLEAKMNKTTPAGTSGISMGDCGMPETPECSTTEHELRKDLQKLINEFLVEDTLTGNVNLFSKVNFSLLMQSYLPSSITSTTSTYVYDTSAMNNYDTLRFNTDEVCNFEIYHNIHDSDAIAVNFSHLIAVTDLTGIPPLDVDGNYHDFYFIGTYNHGGIVSDTVRGTSCWPIKNCNHCDSTTRTPSAMDSTVVNIPDIYDGWASTGTIIAPDTTRCDSTYHYFLNALTHYNNSVYAAQHFDTLDVHIYPTLNLFMNAGYCSSCTHYSDTLEYYAALPSGSTRGKPGRIDLFPYCTHTLPFASTDQCAAAFLSYGTTNRNYNAFLSTHHSLHYPALDTSITSGDFKALYCNCISKYISNLTAIMNGYNPDSATVYGLTRIENSCTTAACVPAAPDTPFVFPPAIYSPNPCVQQMLNIAALNAQNEYRQYTDSMSTVIASRYTQHCLGALENFTYTYTDKEYHFTLYYYDQAGNLVKTIPPEGVQLLDIDSNTDPLERQVIRDRELNQQHVFTSHRMATNYEYNSLNQLIYQDMPDHDKMNIVDHTLPNGLDDRLKMGRTQFINASTGYTTGYIDLGGGNTRSIVYISNNGGNSWTKINNTVAADIHDIFFADSTTAWAVGSKGVVIKTTDGGVNWDAKNLYGTYPQDLYAACFSSTSNGVIAGTKSASYAGIYYTTNGGTSYSAATTSSLANGDTITALTYDGSKYYASVKNAGQGKIYYSSTGTSWTEVTAKRAGDLQKVQFDNVSGTLYAAGADGTLLFSSGTSGTSWAVVPTGISRNFRDIYFSNATDGVAIIDSSASKGQIFKTADGGHSWTLLSTPGDYYTSLQEYTNGKLLASGENGLISTVLLSAPPFGMIKLKKPSLVNDLKYADAIYNTGSPQVIAVGNNDTLYYTPNASLGAMSWTKVKTTSFGVSGGDGNFKKVLIKDSLGTRLNGLVLTQTGKLYAMYKTQGDTFSFSIAAIKDLAGGTISTYFFSDITMDAHNTINFYAFDTISKRPFSGHITSGSATFVYLDTTTAPHQHIQSIAINTGLGSFVMAGTKGKIEQKSNPANINNLYSNRSYTVQPAALNSIATKAANQIYAVGIDGGTWNTSNGMEWRMLNSGTAENLNDIALDGNYGAIAADNGQFYSQTITDSLTLSLSAIDLESTDNLTSVALSDSNAYIGTTGGKLIHVPDITNTAYSNVHVTGMTGGFRVLGIKPTSTQIVYAGGDASAMYQCLNSNSARVNEVYLSSLPSISFSDANNGYLVSSRNDIRHTKDGGNSWSIIVPASTNASNIIYAVKTDQAILLGTNRYVAVINGETSPASITLTGGPSTSTLNMLGLGFNESGYGILGAAQRNIYSVVPSGSTFTVTHLVQAPAPVSGNYAFTAIKVFADSSYLAAGSQARIYYGKGGTLADQMNYGSIIGSPATTILNDMYFLDDRTGYIVGTGGIALKCVLSSNITSIGSTPNSIIWDTLNLSDTYSIFNASTSSTIDLYSIDFIDRHHGFVSGLYNTSPTNARYAMLIDDNSNYYSTRFFYDKLGRMVVSQNSKQYNKTPKAFSYTKYDALGRIKEVGEKSENSSSTTFRRIFGSDVFGTYNVNTINDDSLVAWLAGNGARKEVTKTYYDTIVFHHLPIAQDNLRKRVSDVTYEDADDNVDSTYQHATHYDYDIHGNVRSLVQDNPQVNTTSQRYKRIDYEYDLISGKVNEVVYQPHAPDLFIHRYSYDADNRITKVETSTDDIIYKTDAKYFYYAHGPLARVEYGQNQVQGMDYAYTLQGWIKGVNSNSLLAGRDMGKDGYTDTTNDNTNFGRDAMGYTLGYYTGDYKAIDRLKWNAVKSRFEAQTAGAQFEGQNYDLFNGNISHMVTSLAATDTTVTGLAAAQVPMPLANAYQYDQLNRIKKSLSFNNINIPNNLWQASGQAVNNMYENTFAYDANGNILSQNRFDNAGVKFDSLLYKYNRDVNGNIIQNRLYHVNDPKSSGLQPDDIDDQGAFVSTAATMNTVNNYKYDQIGNLIADSTEQIDTIKWTVYGKIKEIKRAGGSSKKNLKFDYDANGNRISKQILSSSGTWENTTYYVRDAQGNVISTYDERMIMSSLSYKLLEQDIYGSSRLGMTMPDKQMILADTTNEFAFDTLNKRQYELSNHLGNVLTVVYDRKMALDTNSDHLVDYRLADIANSTDYYPFGASMPKRACYNDTTTVAGYDYYEDFGSGTGTFTATGTGVIISGTGLEISSSSSGTMFGAQVPLSLTAGIPYIMDMYIDVNSCSSGTTVLRLKDNTGATIDSVIVTGTARWSILYTPAYSGTYYMEAYRIGGTSCTFYFYDAELSHTAVYTTICPNEQSYRYGFNGKEKDNEVKGEGNQQDYGMRVYDPRLGRFLSVDPLTKSYSELTPYQFASNRPIQGVDIDGLEFTTDPFGMQANPNVFFIYNLFASEKNKYSTTEINKTTDATAKGMAKGVYNGALGSAVIWAPRIGIPWALSDISGVPVTPSPQAWASVAIEVSGVTAIEASEEIVPLYRGVNENHPGFNDATQGLANPRGGNATPLEHNTTTTESAYTSWSTDKQVAENFALRPNGNGVVLEKNVPKSQMIESPNLKSVNLKQSPGVVVSESEVLLKGAVKADKVTSVTSDVPWIDPNLKH